MSLQIGDKVRTIGNNQGIIVSLIGDTEVIIVISNGKRLMVSCHRCIVVDKGGSTNDI